YGDDGIASSILRISPLFWLRSEISANVRCNPGPASMGGTGPQAAATGRVPKGYTHVDLVEIPERIPRDRCCRGGRCAHSYGAGCAGAAAATATAAHRCASATPRGAHRALPRLAVGAGFDRFHLPARSRHGRALVQGESERQGPGPRECDAATELGSRGQGTDVGSPGASDDERQARLDAAARRGVPGAARRYHKAVQFLRARADAAGNLQTTEQQRVIKKPPPPGY